MITIIGRRLIIPDCDRILGVVGDKNTPVKIKLSENTLESYLPGANGFGDVAIILKLEHETATVTVPPILCVHDKEGVYVGDLSILSSVKSGLVSAQAMIVLPGSATDDTALDDAESIWQSDEDYFYIADDIELKSFSNSSDTYKDFQNLLAAVGNKVIAAESAKNAAETAKEAAETAESNAEGAEERINETVTSFNEAYGDFSLQAEKAKEHYDSRSNPHEVTAEQVGAYTKEEVDDKFKNIDVDVDLSDYVKNTDYATGSKGGVVKVYEGNGVSCVNGQLALVPATNTEIDARKAESLPITPKNLEYAVKSVGDGYYATEDAVFETGSFGWMDFPYDVEAAEWDDIYSLSDNQITGGGAQFTIHCKGKTLGFDYILDNISASHIEINGVQYTNGSGSIPLTYMESDIIVYCSLATYEFTNMIQQSIKGVAELELQIGDIDTALDKIIDIAESLAPTGTLG